MVQQGCGVESIVYVAELRDDAAHIKGAAATTAIERVRRVVADEFQVSRCDHRCMSDEYASGLNRRAGAWPDCAVVAKCLTVTLPK